MSHYSSHLTLVVLVLAIVLSLSRTASAEERGILVAAECKETAERFMPLYANFHNHTINTPDDHFLATGMEQEILEAKRYINIFGISDHADQIPAGMWGELNYLATKYTSPGDNFFVLPGSEATYGGLNPLGKDPASHINVFYSGRYFGTKPRVANWGGIYAPTLDDLWARLAEEAASNPKLIFQLNHPWAKGNLRDMAFPSRYSGLRECGALQEVDSGLKPEMSGGIHWYERAIQQSWLVAPTVNNDGPGGLLTGEINRKTAVWVDKDAYARDPSQEVWQAIKDRRVSALNSTGFFQVMFGGIFGSTISPMGTCFTRPSVRPDALGLYFSVTSPNGQPIGHHFNLVVHEVTMTAVRHWRIDLSHLPNRDQSVNAQVVVIAQPETVAYFLVFRDELDTIVTAPVWTPNQ